MSIIHWLDIHPSERSLALQQVLAGWGFECQNGCGDGTLLIVADRPDPQWIPDQGTEILWWVRDGTPEAVSEGLVTAEVELLAAAVAARGGELAGEAEQAVRVACSERRLVVVVGQAGTGKSTALLGVARAHQQAGRTVLVTSTGEYWCAGCGAAC